MQSLDLDAAHAHEHALLELCDARARATSRDCASSARRRDKASLVSFVVAGVHPHDLGTILDEDGIAIRTGHHCAMPVMEFFKVPATARATFAFYNTFEEIDRLAAAIRARPGAVRLSARSWNSTTCTATSSSTTIAGREISVRSSPPTPAPRASIPCAATGSRCGSISPTTQIEDIRFEGQGCAISTASASLMTEAVKGKTRGEALALFDRVHQLLTDDAAGAEDLGKLAALSGVREYPARVKCASLCWHTLASALNSPDAARRAGRVHRVSSDAMRSYENEPIVVQREVKAVAIPAGVEVNLKLGSVGYITQALGGSFTVYIDGNLFRIAGQDADAIGKTPAQAAGGPARRLRRGHQERRVAAAQDLL